MIREQDLLGSGFSPEDAQLLLRGVNAGFIGLRKLTSGTLLFTRGTRWRDIPAGTEKPLLELLADLLEGRD